MSNAMIVEILHRSAKVKDKMISACAGPAELPCIFRNVTLRWGMLLRRGLKFFCINKNEVFAGNFEFKSEV